MKDYILHLDNNLDKADIYKYHGENAEYIHNISITKVSRSIEPNSNVIVFLPSNLISSVVSNKDIDESNEQYHARFFSDHEDNIISDISSNQMTFSTDQKLALIAENSDIDPLNQLFNRLGCNIEIFPEHFLHSEYGKDSCLYWNNRYTISFSNGTGFSVDQKNIREYLDIVEKDGVEFRPICFNFDKKGRSIFANTNSFKEIEIHSLHLEFLKKIKEGERPLSLYLKEFNLAGLLRKFNFGKRDLLIVSLAIAGLIILPLFNIGIMKNYQKSYEQNTFEIFTKLNPNFRRVVNSKLQMDQLLTAMDQNEVAVLDLTAMQYLRTISLNEIVESRVDFDQSIISIELNQLSRIKYKILEELIKSSDINIISNKMVLDDGFASGSLVLELNDE